MQAITAERTNSIVSYVRSEIDDFGYKIVKTDEELFFKGIKVVNEIALYTRCLKTTVNFNIPADKRLFSIAEVGFGDIPVYQIDKVKCPDDDTEYYSVAENELKAIAGSYCFHKSHIHFSPKLHCSRVTIIAITGVSTSNCMWYDREPPTPAVYDNCIADGIIYHCIASLPKPPRNPEYYLIEFNKYRTIVLPTGNEGGLSVFNELNSSV